jgi:hypothetical protein
MAVKLHASAPKRAKFKDICNRLNERCYGWSLDMPVRWSSTFEFLSIALKMKNAIKEMWISDDDLGVYSFDKHGWNRIELVATFLKVIASLI